jgi:hypothetical protein
MPAKKKAVPADLGRVDLVAGIRPVAFEQPGRVGIIGVADGHFRGLGVIPLTIFGKDVDHFERPARGRDDAGIDDAPPGRVTAYFNLRIELVQEPLEYIILEHTLPKPANSRGIGGFVVIE